MPDYIRTGRIQWSPLSDQEKSWYAGVDGYGSGEQFTATFADDELAWLVGEGLIAAVPSSPGGSGSPLLTPKVAVLNLNATLTSDNFWWYAFTTDDLNAAVDGQTWQNGPFSIATDPNRGHGAVASSVKGVYQVAIYASSEYPTLDSGSSKQRFLWVGAQVGRATANVDAGPAFESLLGMGLDIQVPLVAGADDPNGISQAIGVSTPGWNDPADPDWAGITLWNLSVSAIAPHGTDSIPVSLEVAIYQIA